MPDTENVDLGQYIIENDRYLAYLDPIIVMDRHIGSYVVDDAKIDLESLDPFTRWIGEQTKDLIDFSFEEREHELLDTLHPEKNSSPEAQLIADSRLLSVVKMLVEQYFDSIQKIGLEMTTDSHLIDIFLKLKDKRSIAIMLRSNGKSKIKWRDDKKSFYVAKSGKSPAIQALKSTIVWKDRPSPFLGNGQKERKRPIIKVIVLCHGTRLNSNNAPELWDTFGQARVLRVYDETLVFVVEQDDLIKFLSPTVAESCQTGNNEITSNNK
jgi:hypothetical protein